MTSDESATLDPAALAGVTLSDADRARLARTAEGLRASLVRLARLDLQDVEPATCFALDEDEHA